MAVSRCGRGVIVAALALPLLAAQAPPGLPLAAGGDFTATLDAGHVLATPGDDWINDLVQLRNGNVLAVGFLNRSEDGSPDWLAVAVELSGQGAPVSDRRYGANGGIDAFWSAAEAADGGRILAGFTTRIGPAGINGLVLATRSDGTIIKENGFGHAGYDRFTDLVATNGGFLFVGHSQLADHGAPRRTYVVKTDAAGFHQWERIFGGPEAWSALYIEPAGDGGFVIAGGTDGGGDNDMFVLKVDADGREIWRRRVGTPDWDEINHGLVVRPDRRIVLVGYTHPRGSESNDFVATVLSPDGQVERLERFGGAGDDRAINGRADADGLIWIVGQTASAGAGGYDVLLTSFHPDRGFTGKVMTLGGTADDIGTVVHPMGGGSQLLAGYSRNLGTASQDAFLTRVKLSPKAGSHPAFRRALVRPD